MTPLPRLLAAIALATLASAPAAETGDREKPINFSSDRGDLNYETKLGKLDGNVVLTQGTITVRADRLSFKQLPDNSMQVTAFGNPVSFRQKRDNSDEYYEGFAQRIEYDGSRELLELFDRALLKRGVDEIRSGHEKVHRGAHFERTEQHAMFAIDEHGRRRTHQKARLRAARQQSAEQLGDRGRRPHVQHRDEDLLLEHAEGREIGRRRHCSLNTSAGSVIPARRAGTKAAPAPIASSTRPAAATAIGSTVLTP